MVRSSPVPYNILVFPCVNHPFTKNQHTVCHWNHRRWTGLSPPRIIENPLIFVAKGNKTMLKRIHVKIHSQTTIYSTFCTWQLHTAEVQDGDLCCSVLTFLVDSQFRCTNYWLSSKKCSVFAWILVCIGDKFFGNFFYLPVVKPGLVPINCLKWNKNHVHLYKNQSDNLSMCCEVYVSMWILWSKTSVWPDQLLNTFLIVHLFKPRIVLLNK